MSRRRAFPALTILAGLAAAVASGCGGASSAPVSGPPPLTARPPAGVNPSLSPSVNDRTPPETNVLGADDSWHRAPVRLTFLSRDEDSGVLATHYRVDEGEWIAGDALTVEAPQDHSNDGVHTVSFSSTDAALNQEPVKSVQVKIDTLPPAFAWKGISPTDQVDGRPLTLRFSLAEETGPLKLSYEVVDQYGYLARSKSGIVERPGERALRLPPRYADGRVFVPSVYRVTVRATDTAGNATVSEPFSFRNHRPAEGGVWRRVGGAGRRVALTFDDGYSAAAWARILDELARGHSHGTFFLLGPNAAANPDLMRRTVAEGHAIGSHGWTHEIMRRQSARVVQREWARSETPWWQATGFSPVPYGRPPYGDISRRTTTASAAVGYYRTILWDVDPRDWERPGPKALAARVVRRVRPGSIVVMHTQSQTAAALPRIIRGLRKRGYKLVSVPELFRAAGYR